METYLTVEELAAYFKLAGETSLAFVAFCAFRDCFAKGSYPALQGDKKGMNPETNTLPKQHTSSLQGEVVDLGAEKNIRKAVEETEKKYC